MRITNKIMQNNSLYNINSNKVLQDKLNTQMATQKKITRPSDDPIIAIRALRLRSNVAQVTQYNDKNAPDANSWLSVTSDALGTLTEVLNELVDQATKAANKDRTASDLQILMQQMESLTEEFYATGNVDFAGRYVFTGYRTGTPMTFNKEDVLNDRTYSITEQLKIGNASTIKYTNVKNLDKLTKETISNATKDEQEITTDPIIRFQLAYNNTDTDPGGANKISVKDSNGNTLIADADITTISLNADPDPYAEMVTVNKASGKKAIYIPETGELLISDELYKDTFPINPPPAPSWGADDEIRITYEKSKWKEGDLRPEHYFACTEDPSGDNIVHNKSYLTANPDKQHIEYDVGYNQKIRVNTTADEVFGHSIRRKMDDLKAAVDTLSSMGNSVNILKEALAAETDDATVKDLTDQLDAAKKAYEEVRQNVHTMFEGTITTMQNGVDNASVAITDNGTRSQRLDLISNRLLSQKTTFRDLQSVNEDADITEVAIQLNSMDLSYQSALMATGKIMQTSLMHFI